MRDALVRIELLLEVCLGVRGPAQREHGNRELLATTRAHADCRSRAQPFEDPKQAFRHDPSFPQPYGRFPAL